MNTFGKTTLLAGASALAMGLATSQASAFDETDWDWIANIYEHAYIHIDIDHKYDPSGLVQVEKLQIFAGNVAANAFVGEVIHDPYQSVTYETHSETTTGGFTGSFDGAFLGGVKGTVYDEEIKYLTEEERRVCTSSWWGGKECKKEEYLLPHYEADTDPFHGVVAGGLWGGFEGSYSEVTTYDVAVPDPLHRAQLPKVEVAATAIANVESIDSDVAVYVNEGQFAIGGITGDVAMDHKIRNWWGGDSGGVDDWLGDKNEHTGLADAMLELMSDGNLVKANITANAGIGYSTQTQVDLSATAIANAHSINLDAVTADDAIVIADLTQFAYADVTANAILGKTYVTGYDDLGKLTDPLTSVVATAIGNVSNITVCAYNCDFSNGTEE